MNFKKNISKAYLVFYVFCFLFAPPLIPGINFSIILGIFSAVMILLKYGKKLTTLFRSKALKKVSFLIFAYIAVYLISWVISMKTNNADIYENGVINIYSFFLNFVITFICSIYLVFKCDDMNIDKYELIKYFIYAGLIQLGIALVALLSPEFKTFTIDLMRKETNERLLNSTWLVERRFFGLSNNLLDLFGFGTGIIATLPLFYATKTGKKHYLLLSPLLAIVPLLNARSGIVIYLLGIIVWIIGMIISKRLGAMRVIFVTPIIIVLFMAAYNAVSVLSPGTIEWVENDIASFMTSDSNGGTASIIYSNEYWNMPEGSNLLIGAGHNVSAYSSLKVKNIEYTDNGYINELWKVGLIGIIIYFLINLNMLSFCYKEEKDIIIKTLYIFFGMAMIVMLVKCSLMGYNPGNVIIYTMFIASIALNDKRKVNNEAQ